MGEPIDLTHRFEPVGLDAWREQVRQDLRGREPEALRWRSPDGVEVDTLYVASPRPPRGAPGAPPFVRGGASKREWCIVAEATGHDRAAILQSAERALREGADALWLGPDECAWLERGSDLEPLRALGAPVWLDPGPRSTALAALWLSGPSGAVTVLADPLGALARLGSLPTSIERALVHLADLVGHAAKSAPTARPILASGRPYHEAGAGAADELGITIATGVAYLRGLSEAGRPLADLPRRMLFELAMDADFFVGIAKLRAARLLWSKVLRTLGIDGPEQGLCSRARSARRGTSALDPHVNVLRGTAAALGAVLGGAELVTVAPFDELGGAPSAHAERLARNTQLIMREEAHLGRVLDPAGGSYFLEELTDQLARRAWAVMQEIEQRGGVPRALADGSLAERMRAGREALEKAVAARERGLIGVNRYPSRDAPPAEAGRAPALVADAPPRSGASDEGTASRAGHAPGSGRQAASGPVIRALMEALAERSVSELSAALGHADTPAAVEALEPRRDAERFEALRRRAALLPEGRRRAVVVGVGDARVLRPRTDFARDVLELAGLDVTTLGPSASPADAIAALPIPAPFVVAPCASPDDATSVLAALGPALRGRGVRCIVGATRPSDELGAAGADVLVHRGADLATALEAILSAVEEGP